MLKKVRANVIEQYFGIGLFFHLIKDRANGIFARVGSHDDQRIFKVDIAAFAIFNGAFIKQVVEDALLDAALSKEEAQELHIFLGSTSMSISINEEAHLNFLNHNTPTPLKEIGYGTIGNFIEDLIQSKHSSTIIQSACTSSSNAFCYAANLIKNRKIEKALVIGLELFNRATYEGFNSLMLLSQSQKYKPFDKNSDGLILAEACSAIVLSPIQTAQNNFRYCSSTNHFDNHSLTNSSPDGKVSFECMKKAITKANITLQQITCLKAHASGTNSSNLSEANAIEQLFQYYKHKMDVVVLKPFIGHTLGACGVSEIVLLCECIKNGFIPKTLGFSEKYDELSFTPLQTNKNINKATILFNYIGFGGSNSSIILSNEQ